MIHTLLNFKKVPHTHTHTNTEGRDIYSVVKDGNAENHAGTSDAVNVLLLISL